MHIYFMNDMATPLWLKFYTNFTFHSELEYDFTDVEHSQKQLFIEFQISYINNVIAHDIKYKNRNMLITYCSLSKERLKKYICFYLNNNNILTAMRNDKLLYTIFTTIAIGILLIPMAIRIRFMFGVVIDDIPVVVRTGYCHRIRHCC